MTIIWNIVRKDLLRLRFVLAAWAGFIAVKLCFYAYLAGFWGTPNLTLFRNMGNQGGNIFVAVVEGVVAYFLVGWLVQNDPATNTDPFWVTRPVSGRQMFAAKILGTMLMFGFLPVLIHLPWWIAVGFGVHEFAESAGLLLGTYAVICGLALTVGSLTDGFPRFILWTLVGVTVMAVVMTLYSFYLPGPRVREGVTFSRLGVLAATVCVVGLCIAFYQYAARRLWRSVAIAAAGVVLVPGLAAFWTIDLTLPAAPTVASVGGGEVRLAGMPVYWPEGSARSNIDLPLRIEGLPDDSVAALEGRAEWNMEGRSLAAIENYQRFQFNIVDVGMKERVRQIVGMRSAGSTPLQGFQTRLSHSVGASISQRIAKGPATFRADLQLTVLPGRLVTEIPLTGKTERAGGRSYSLANAALKPTPRSLIGKKNFPYRILEKYIAVEFTVRSDLLVPFYAHDEPEWRRPAELYALVNRKTGEVVFATPFIVDEAFARIGQVGVESWLLAFMPESPESWLKDGALVVIRFEPRAPVARTVEIDPFVMEPTKNSATLSNQGF